MSVNVRPSQLSDLEVIVNYNSAMARETEDRDLDRALLTRGVTSIMEQPSNGFYLVAEIDGCVVGQAMITYEWSDWRNGLFWWLQSVYVHPDYRRRGVYSALYAHVLTCAQEAEEVRGLRLYVESNNMGAQEAYRKLGMHKASYDMYEVDFAIARQTRTIT